MDGSKPMAENSQRRFAGATALCLFSLVLAGCNNSTTPRPEALVPQDLPLTSDAGRLSLNQMETSGMPTYTAGSLAFSDIALHPNGEQNVPAGPKLSTAANHISNSTKFSSKAYGVSKSPRLSTSVYVRKGGGSYKIGKPYKIRGVRYVPKLDKNYRKRGMASWYGPNFHGRLTANGEVYDQFALSAAHPTMPLPSYAKVTNLENGASLIVRVNDRGPYSKRRIIDLSSRAAQLLGYTKFGTAKVEVRYVGKARMDGLDEEYLVGSYDPGMLDPSTIPPNGRDILIAQNGELPATPAQPKLRPGASKPRNSFLAALFGWSGKADNRLSAVQVSGRRPLSNLTGFAEQQTENRAASKINDISREYVATSSDGMSGLAGFVIGPADNRKEANKLAELLSQFGPHHLVNDKRAGRYFYVTVAREQIPALHDELNNFTDRN